MQSSPKYGPGWGRWALLLQIEGTVGGAEGSGSSGMASSSSTSERESLRPRWSDWESWALQGKQDITGVKKRARVHVQLHTVNQESLVLGTIETWVDSQAAIQVAFQVEEQQCALGSVPTDAGGLLTKADTAEGMTRMTVLWTPSRTKG